MKKKPDGKLGSSSSCRENSPKTLNANSIGCMAGIFRLVYNYNSGRRGKFLTFAKKTEKNTVSSSLQQEGSSKVTRFSCDVPRSPTLPAEIRLSNALKSPENFRTTPSHVGLDNVEAAEKRRRLLEALEKCDKDLKALKEIIDVVKSSVVVELEDNSVNGGGDNNRRIMSKNFEGKQQRNLEIKGDLQLQPQPSPVSVLDDLTPSSALSLNSYSRRYTNGRAIIQQQQQQKHKQKKKPGEEEDITNICLATSSCDISSSEILAKMREKQNMIISPFWASKAMIDSVNQVCRDMAWGEKREIGRIGLALQDFICRDLIEEIVTEQLGSISLCMYSLPFQACQRRLRF